MNNDNTKIYTILVTSEDLKLIGATLANLPYSQVAGLLTQLQIQINEQEKPVETKQMDVDTPEEKPI